MCLSIQQFVNTGMVKISTANSNLDGTGTIGTVLTAADDGTFIKSITIKAIVSTTQGMVRLFINNGTGNIYLMKEITIPATTQTGVEPAFRTTIIEPFSLKSGYSLGASTQNSEAFIVIADGIDLKNCNWPA